MRPGRIAMHHARRSSRSLNLGATAIALACALTLPSHAFAQHGHTGSWFSELLPNLARHADKLCWLRGLHTDTPAHPQAVV